MRFVAILLLCLTASPCRAADWSVEIAPYQLNEPLKIIRFGETVFYVDLRNTSKRDLMIWSDVCSWGGANLSFEATRADGSKFKLRKIAIEYTWNQPTPEWADPGELISLKVRLGQDWGVFPKDWKDGETVQLRAIYAEHPDSSWSFGPGPAEEKKEIDQIKAKFEGSSDDLAKIIQSMKASWQRERDGFKIAWVGHVISPPISVQIDAHLSRPPY